MVFIAFPDARVQAGTFSIHESIIAIEEPNGKSLMARA